MVMYFIVPFYPLMHNFECIYCDGFLYIVNVYVFIPVVLFCK